MRYVHLKAVNPTLLEFAGKVADILYLKHARAFYLQGLTVQNDVTDQLQILLCLSYQIFSVSLRFLD